MTKTRGGQAARSLIKKTRETERIESVLRSEFPQTEAYRYNSASIRVRVIDERFEGKALVDRERLVRDLIRTLPETTQADILMLLLLTPAERTKSLLNLEFEQPSPTKL